MLEATKLPKNVAPLYNNNALVKVKNSNYNLIGSQFGGFDSHQ